MRRFIVTSAAVAALAIATAAPVSATHGVEPLGRCPGPSDQLNPPWSLVHAEGTPEYEAVDEAGNGDGWVCVPDRQGLQQPLRVKDNTLGSVRVNPR